MSDVYTESACEMAISRKLNSNVIIHNEKWKVIRNLKLYSLAIANNISNLLKSISTY